MRPCEPSYRPGPSPDARTLRSLNESLGEQVDTLVWLFGSAFDESPAVCAGEMSRAEAAELFLRLAYSPMLVPHSDSEELLGSVQAIAGLHRRSLNRAA